MPKKDDTYDSMILKLEKMVESMSSEELSLEDAMKNYEEGIKICNKLYALLNKAEGKIKILRDGESTEEEFSSGEE